MVQRDNVSLRDKLDIIERDFDRTQRRLAMLERRSPWSVVQLKLEAPWPRNACSLDWHDSRGKPLDWGAQPFG